MCVNYSMNECVDEYKSNKTNSNIKPKTKEKDFEYLGREDAGKSKQDIDEMLEGKSSG